MKTITVTAAALLASGCALLTAPETPRLVQLHIDGAGAEIAAAPATGRSLLVAPPRPHPGYAGTRFAYIQHDHQLAHYGRHVWADDPGKLIRAALVRALERSGAFAAVIVAPSPANADLRFDLELVTLHQDFRARRGSELVLAMRAQVVDLAARRVVATRSFEFREPAGAGPLDGAAAADRALARMLEAVTAFAAEAAAGHRGPQP